MTAGAFVSAQNYSNYSGYGSSDSGEVAELRKALSAGQDVTVFIHHHARGVHLADGTAGIYNNQHLARGY